ncbi:hypothetical protein, partial [Mesorhizobium waimense]|uniref:hypothetical protein n=1 Tax=Mesorhizobium waimense TaxID=1300307 RepID=UPI001FE0A650
MTTQRLSILSQLERKVLWLAIWTIHNANHLRDNGDGLKVGGHQASSASLNTILTALYFAILRPEDRVAVKPHASPIYSSGTEVRYIVCYVASGEERIMANANGRPTAPLVLSADEQDYL